MGRRGVLLVVIVGLGGVLGVPAMATQGPTITASDFEYTPPSLPIPVGGTVTFANAGGFHNFSFDDGQEFPSSARGPDDPAWNGLSRTFTQPGAYAFHCEAHPTQMQGTIIVGDATPTPTPTPTATPRPTPTPTPPGGGSDPGPGGTGERALEVRTLRTAGTAFCVRRSRRCRRPGVRIRIDLSRAATVTGTLARRGRSFGRVSFGTVAAGPRTLRFTRTASGRRLTPGRYTLAIRVAGDPARTLRFRVR
jgi:plastocyanin